jgi:hypothetical protein
MNQGRLQQEIPAIEELAPSQLLLLHFFAIFEGFFHFKYLF